MRAIRPVTSVLAACLLLTVATACAGSKGGGGLPTELCTPDTKTCLGSYAAVCAADGRSWIDLRPCFPDNACIDGACVPRLCTPAGKDRCDGVKTARICSDDGMVYSLSQCPDFQSCYAGACLPDDCDATKDLPVCSFDTLVTCVDGHRQAQACPAGQACDGNACHPKEDCTPEEARCSGEAASGICSLNASRWVPTVCKANEHCLDGFCQSRLADLPGPDVVEDVAGDLPADGTGETGGDVGPQPDVPVIVAPNRVTLNGALVEFDFLPSLSLTPASDQGDALIGMLLQSGKKQDLPLPLFPDSGASLQMEISILGMPVDQLANLKGTYACGGEAGTPRAMIWLRYGLHPTATEGNCVNFDFAAGSCTVEVTDVGPDGLGPLKGTFSAPGMGSCLADSMDPVASVTDGAFEVALP